MRIKKRNLILLQSVLENKTFKETNSLLIKSECKETNEKEWVLWSDYYKPLMEDNILYQKEILINDRSLDWFARDLKKQTKKDILS